MKERKEHKGQAFVVVTRIEAAERCVTVRYWKKKSRCWAEFIILGAVEINKVLLWKKLTQKLHNESGRVFWQVRKERLHGQPQGKGYFSRTLANNAAKAIGLKNWAEFSGHSWCRSSATYMAEQGASVNEMKIWKLEEQQSGREVYFVFFLFSNIFEKIF